MAGTSVTEVSRHHGDTITEAIDEETPLLVPPHGHDGTAKHAAGDDEGTKSSRSAALKMFVVLVSGVFIANGDTSLVMATYAAISSAFESLGDASWIITSYMMAMCASQLLYGKLSDIFGRKRVLLIAYALFGIGNGICGLAPTMAVLVLGRIISGIGGAGIVLLVNVLIAGMFPARESAQYRGYVNVIQTAGRSLGGPIGGFLAETIGWRASFLCQVPFILFSAILVWWELPSAQKGLKAVSDETTLQKLKRIDFLGAAVLSGAIISGLFLTEMIASVDSWTNPLFLGLLGAVHGFGLLFALVETFWAKEPVFPLSFLKSHDINCWYFVLSMQNLAQSALMFVIPLYFQVTASNKASAAGARLIPAVIGNTAGGLLCGWYIKKTGRYKLPTVLASLVACSGFSLLVLRWHGHTNIFESFYVFFGGFGTGVAHSSVFTGLTAAVTEDDLAIACSGLFLGGNIGAVTGVSTASAMMQSTVQKELVKRLHGIKDADKILDAVLSNVDSIRRLSGHVRELVVGAYVVGFHWTMSISIVCSAAALLYGLTAKVHKLPQF